MTQTPQLDVTPALRANVHAARIDVTYQPTQPDPAAQHPWGATIQRAVTVIFEAKLSDEATVAAAAADPLFMRAPHPDATPPPPLPPTTWHSGWRYRQPDDAAPELQLIVQLDNAEDWGYVIAFTPSHAGGSRSNAPNAPAGCASSSPGHRRTPRQSRSQSPTRPTTCRPKDCANSHATGAAKPTATTSSRSQSDDRQTQHRHRVRVRVEADHDSDERWAGGVAAPPAGVKRRSGCGHRALCGA